MRGQVDLAAYSLWRDLLEPLVLDLNSDAIPPNLPALVKAEVSASIILSTGVRVFPGLRRTAEQCLVRTAFDGSRRISSPGQYRYR